MSTLAEKLKKIGEAYQPTYADGDVMVEAAAELTRLQSRISVLEEALRPFAEAVLALDDDVATEMRCDDDYPIGDSLWDYQQPTVGHLRAAARALSQVTPE